MKAFQEAINNSSPGDVVILANGTYHNTSQITIKQQGTASGPITIAAERIGGVTITGSLGK